MVHAYNASLERLGMEQFSEKYRLSAPAALANPFMPDAETVRGVLAGAGVGGVYG